MPESDDSESDSADDLISKPVAAAVGEIIKAAADEPNVKAAGNELGRAALTVAKALNVVLLPIAAINFGYERARDYFQSKFEPDLQEKLADVPPDEIVEPKPSIAGPIIQGLTFSHDETALRDMYLNLLASAMDKRNAAAAHPAFVEIIKQLTAEEAQALCTALGPPAKEIVQVRSVGPTGFQIMLNHLMSVNYAATGEPFENKQMPAWVDNWIRLGLVDVSYVEFLSHEATLQRYTWAQTRPEFIRIKAEVAQLGDKRTVVAAPGRFLTTAFGTEFYRIVGLDKMRLQMILGKLER